VSRGTRLTTTSYAVLGLLAIRPWTPYELTQQIQRSMRRFWPRAESKLYEEPKKLVALGLATAASEPAGRRRRTVYSVTLEGRRRLAAWLAEPTSTPQLESEHLLKVFLAEHGTRADLLATLAELREWAEQRALDDARIARAYLVGEGPFPERAAQLVLVGRYSADFADMTRRWARWAEELVVRWPERVTDAEPELGALEEIVARVPPSAL
jgi:PadR family transcriptional regulator AphA